MCMMMATRFQTGEMSRWTVNDGRVTKSDLGGRYANGPMSAPSRTRPAAAKRLEAASPPRSPAQHTPNQADSERSRGPGPGHQSLRGKLNLNEFRRLSSNLGSGTSKRRRVAPLLRRRRQVPASIRCRTWRRLRRLRLGFVDAWFRRVAQRHTQIRRHAVAHEGSTRHQLFFSGEGNNCRCSDHARRWRVLQGPTLVGKCPYPQFQHERTTILRSVL